ncbi:hypothetical protein BH10BAC1_BH10BAC1_06640 [soil metagenome]
MKKITQHILVLSLVAVVFNSCSEKKSALSKYGPELEGVMRSEFGTFRGFDLGESMDTISIKEAENASEADEGYLYYEYSLPDSNSYNISYNFDEKGLNEIQSDVYIHNAANTEKVFNSFKTYFDDHFGQSENHQGFTVWTVKSDKYGVVRINLSDDSADLTVPGSPGKIALWIYPDNE